MAKTKLFNVKNAFTLVRPDGTSQTFLPGAQEISTEKYAGKVSGFDKDGKPAEVDHPENANSDATHWHVLANADLLQTKEEREASEAEAKAAGEAAKTAAVAAAQTPAAAKSDGTTAKAADAGKAVPNA